MFGAPSGHGLEVGFRVFRSRFLGDLGFRAEATGCEGSRVVGLGFRGLGFRV